MTEAMRRRAAAVCSRAAVRTWEYRQRMHAKGVWFRLRRLLAESSAVYAIPSSEIERLTAEGCTAEPVGLELEPPKAIMFVTAERAGRIAGARQLPVKIGVELLAARCLALVRFP
jgi:hypothetical protein